MLFNSWEFILCFLPVTLAVYFILNKMRLTVAANAWLLGASLFFYSWWNISYLPLILGSILFNYTIGSLIIDNDTLKKKSLSTKAIFVSGVFINIAFLCYFKYMDFFINNINSAINVNIPLMHIILPIGISFFTITQIAFLVDCYEGLVEERKLLNYAMFVTFFPHLLAGPILHHQEMMCSSTSPGTRSYPIDPTAYAHLKGLIFMAREKGARVVAYYHPIPYKVLFASEPSFRRYQQQINTLFDVRDLVWDFNTPSYDTFRKNPANYIDHGHLSVAGADFVVGEFSRLLAVRRH